MIGDASNSTEIRYLSWTFTSAIVLDAHLRLKGCQLKLGHLPLMDTHASPNQAVNPEVTGSLPRSYPERVYGITPTAIDTNLPVSTSTPSAMEGTTPSMPWPANG